MRAPSDHAARPLPDSLCVVVDEASQQLLAYVRPLWCVRRVESLAVMRSCTAVQSDDITSGSVAVPKDLFDKYEHVSFRSDLLDCQVAVCSPEVRSCVRACVCIVVVPAHASFLACVTA
jgi:hypothetical protein